MKLLITLTSLATLVWAVPSVPRTAPEEILTSIPNGFRREMAGDGNLPQLEDVKISFLMPEVIRVDDTDIPSQGIKELKELAEDGVRVFDVYPEQINDAPLFDIVGAVPVAMFKSLPMDVDDSKVMVANSAIPQPEEIQVASLPLRKDDEAVDKVIVVDSPFEEQNDVIRVADVPMSYPEDNMARDFVKIAPSELEYLRVVPESDNELPSENGKPSVYPFPPYSDAFLR